MTSEKQVVITDDRHYPVRLLIHAIRRHMDHVHWVAQEMRKGRGEFARGDYLKVIDASFAELNPAVCHMEDYVQLIQKEYPLYLETVDVAAHLDRAVQQIAPLVFKRGSEIVFTSTLVEPCLVKTDVDLFVTLLNHLLAKIARNVSQGSLITVALKILPGQEASSCLLQLHVDDLTESLQRASAQVFRTVSEEVNANNENLDFVMLFVRQGIAYLGGETAFISDNRGGGTFELRFPCVKGRRSAKEAQELAHLKQYRGLIYESNRKLAENLQSLLQPYVGSVEIVVTEKQEESPANTSTPPADFIFYPCDPLGQPQTDETRGEHPPRHSTYCLVTHSRDEGRLDPIKRHQRYLQKPLRLKEILMALLDDEGQEHYPVRRVLVVEDDVLAQKALRHRLEQLRCTVFICGSGEEALNYLQQGGAVNFDVIFLDIDLPGMNGLQAASILQARLKEKTPPIIAHTATTAYADQDLLSESGLFTAVLIKPASSEDIAAVVEEVCCY